MSISVQVPKEMTKNKEEVSVVKSLGAEVIVLRLVPGGKGGRGNAFKDGKGAVRVGFHQAGGLPERRVAAAGDKSQGGKYVFP